MNRKNKIILLFLTILISGCIVLPYIFTKTPMMIGWDMRTQYSYFYENLQTMIETSFEFNSLPFYSWSTFLGNNFWASKLFYYHDIFDYICAIAKISYNNAIILQVIIKSLIAAASFAMFARYNKYTDKTIIIGSLLFAFSAFSLESMKDPFFHSFYVFLPLYFFMIDRYLKEKKIILYALLVFFLSIMNYYSFYSLSVFTVIYVLYKYYDMNGNFKGIIKSNLLLIFGYIVGVLLASFALVPEAFSILQNPRIGEKSSLLFFDSIKPYMNILSAWIYPTSVTINRVNEFESVFKFVTSNNTVLNACLWAGSITTILLPQVFFAKNRKHNKILMCILILIMLIPFGSSIMHGFSEPAFRWFQLPTFIFIMIILSYLENFKTINMKVLKISVLLIIIVLITSIPITGIMNSIHYLDYIKEYFLALIYIIPILLLLYFITKGKKNGVMVVTIVELAITAFLSMYGNSYFRQFSKEQVEGVNHALQNKGDLNNYLLGLEENNDSQFYRIYVDSSSIYWDYSTNLNMQYDLMGLMTYDSTYSPSIIDMNKIIDISSYLPWSFEIKDENIIDFLCVKYAVVTDESQLPNDNYSYVGEFNWLKVYENNNYYNFVKNYSEIITYEQIKDTQDSTVIDESIICSIDDYEKLKKYIVEDTTIGAQDVKFSANQLNFNFYSSEESLITIPIPYDNGWKILVNGQVVEKYNVNGGVMGIIVNQGENKIEMYFIPEGFKAGVILSIIGVFSFGILVLKYRKSQK